jgi:glutamyl-tRNA synthetase
VKDVKQKIESGEIKIDTSSNPDFNKRIADLNFVQQVVKLTREKIHFVNEIWNLSSYFFIAPVKFEEAVIAKKWNENAKKFFINLNDAYSKADALSIENAEAIFKQLAESAGVKPGEYMQLHRVLLIGVAAGPGLFETVAILGKDEVVRRLSFALKNLN